MNDFIQSLQGAEPIDKIIARILIALPESVAKKDIFVCGNCKENALIYDRVTKSKPRVCSRCTCEVDWVGLKSILINQCPRPQCGKVYSLLDQACSEHIPPVNLVQVEVPI